MKKTFSVLAMLICTIYFAQGANLTKEETINYINKKIKETEGHYLKLDFEGKIGVINLYYYGSTLELSDDKLTYSRSRGSYKERQSGTREFVSGHGYQYFYPCDYYTIQDELTFSAANIISIEKYNDELNKNSPIATVQVNISSNTGIFKRTAGAVNSKFNDGDFYGRCTDFKEATDSKTVSAIYFSYLKGDDSNFNKLKKAFEYLRDLSKAEDDPFGN